MATATPAKPEMIVLPSVGEGGTPVFAVLVKRTYDIRPSKALARVEKDEPILQADRYYDDGDPETTTVRYESDLAPFKPATDVVVVGKAYAPKGRPVPVMDVAVMVAQAHKVVRVFGDRRCEHRSGRDPSWTDPEPFTEMEVRYERAYGGVNDRSDPTIPFYYPRNTKGRGVALTNVPEVVNGLRLPNFEDPKDLLTPERVVLGKRTRWNQQPLPQGLGWFEKVWYPRCSFVGAVPGDVNPEEPLREEGLGLVPKGQVALARRFQLPSFDVRFNNGASPGLILPHLSGREHVTLLHLTRDGVLEFDLPGDPPRIMLDISLGENALTPVLHTVCIRPEDMKVDLVWQGAQEYPGVEWLPEMKCLRVEVN